jgi:hypothetical protein
MQDTDSDVLVESRSDALTFIHGREVRCILTSEKFMFGDDELMITDIIGASYYAKDGRSFFQVFAYPYYNSCCSVPQRE